LILSLSTSSLVVPEGEVNFSSISLALYHVGNLLGVR
jgi:hypothetical protein